MFHVYAKDSILMNASYFDIMCASVPKINQMIPDQSESVMLVSSAVPTKSPPVTSVWVGLNRRVWYW